MANYQPIRIQAWTDQATEARRTVTIVSPMAMRGTSNPLAIPISGDQPIGPNASTLPDVATYPRREPMRRDSLRRREAILKGNEGSRQRRRWENDRLLNNPWAQPPLPIDWEVHPTYRKQVVPYYLAPLWDAEMAARREEEQKKRRAKAKQGPKEEDTTGKIPKELREKLKRQKAAKGLLQDLEEEVRKFVKNWELKQKELAEDGLGDVDSDEDEIVFVGRSGQMHDMPPSPKRNRKWEDDDVDTIPSPKANRQLEPDFGDIGQEKLVYDSLANDKGAKFGRWLVHSIANYYGLKTWSVTTGNPARREAYVGIKRVKETPMGDLPLPLWGMV